MRAVRAGLGVLLFCAAPALASVDCEQVGGPSGATRLSISIEDPADGAIIAPTSGCGGVVIIRGTYDIEAPPLLYDFYIVIDASGSADANSGSDVDGDGIFNEPDDTIYMAEIRAAQEFILALEPAYSRVAVVVFNRSATVMQPLTADLAAAIATLDAMRRDRPRWSTAYVDAMEAVRLEMLARGDLAGRRQRCIFLSDGQPNEPLAETNAKAAELAALGLVFDTFALGFSNSAALRGMANVSGGRFTALANPGDIVHRLPDFAPDLLTGITAREEGSGAIGVVVVNESTSTFVAYVPLRPGLNRASITLSAGDPAITVTCSINLTMPEALLADAGAPVTACGLEAARLDASGSFAACAVPLYRWRDCTGRILSHWNETPFFDVTPCALACAEVTVEISCPGEACVAMSVTQAECIAAPGPAPALVSSCGLSAVLTCGMGDPGLEYSWDLDPRTDSDLDGDPANDADASGCDLALGFDMPGRREFVAWSADPATGCAGSSPFDFVVVAIPEPRAIDGGICPGTSVELSCGVAVPGRTYWWDLDGAVDSDFDGESVLDRDALGCDVTHVFTDIGSPRVHAWSEDSSGCLRLVATGVFDISASATPGETHDLRVARDGDALTVSWTPTPGGLVYHVLRGSLTLLHETDTYDHAADDAASRGACALRGARSFTDPDDALSPEAFYYLVTSASDCGGEGRTGFAFDGHQLIARPGRFPTSSCP